jgi:prophage antirepressor-like protein
MFCAKDVCNALGYNNSRDAERNHVEIEDVEKIYTPTKGGKQMMAYVSESVLCSHSIHKIR